jgi:hypothetical protein
MTKTICNTCGRITKKETLRSAEGITNSRALVLENISPFPGYHGSTVPDKLEPDSMFAVTKLMHKDEVVIRAIQAVKNKLGFDFDAAPATINLSNKPRNAIRFKNLEYPLIGEALKEFENTGITFRKAKRVSAFASIIKVHKFFGLEETGEFSYKDTDCDKITYFTVPALLRWNTFERITVNCKYNLDDNNFDAAMATVYLNRCIIDLVRIYDNNSSTEKLNNIRKKYIEALSKQ